MSKLTSLPTLMSKLNSLPTLMSKLNSNTFQVPHVWIKRPSKYGTTTVYDYKYLAKYDLLAWNNFYQAFHNDCNVQMVHGIKDRFKEIKEKSCWFSRTFQTLKQTRNLLEARKLRMTSRQLWPRLTFSSDLLTPKLTVSCPSPVDHLCHVAAKLAHIFKNIVFTSLVTYEQIDRWRDR